MAIKINERFALGLPHGDEPDCVAPSLRSLKITLNDAQWSTNEARAKGLRRLGLIQLGSRDAFDEKVFTQRVTEMTIRKVVPIALRAVASMHLDEKHKVALETAAVRCEQEGTRNAARAATNAINAINAAVADAAAAARAAVRAATNATNTTNAADAAYAAYAAARAATNAAARDKVLSDFAEAVVVILVEMNAPGARWLELAPLEG